MPLQKAKSVWFVPVLSWCVYMAVYFGRINLSIAIPLLQNELGYSKAMLGVLAAGFFTAYAAGQLINGIAGDRMQVRIFVTLGLAAAGICNIVFCAVQFFPLMLLVWSANGYFQSMLWGPLLRTLSECVPEAKLKQARFLMSTSPILGHFLSYVLVGRIAVSFGWKDAFLYPGIMLLAMAVFWYCSIAGFLVKKPGQEKNSNSLDNETPVKLRVMDFIIQSKLYYIIIFGVLMGIVKEGLTLWSPVIFIDYFFIDMNNTLTILSLKPLVTLLIALITGLLYKKYLRGDNGIILIYLAAAVFSALAVWCLQDIALVLRIIFYFGIIAALGGIGNILTSYLPFNFRKSKRVSAVAGIIDSSLYLGAAISGPLIGAVVEVFGWNGIFGGILGTCVIMFVPCLVYAKTAPAVSR